MFQDSIEGLLKAIEYLKRPQWDMKIKKNPKTSNPERHRQREIVHKFIVENPIGPTQTRARLLVAQTGWTLEKARTAIRRHKPHLDMAISSTFEPYLEQMP